MNRLLKNIAVNLLLILLAFTVQTCVFPLFPFLSAYPNLLLILIFSFGFIRGSQAGMIYGLLAGLLMDLSSGGPSQEELEELFMDIGDQLEDDLNDIMYELYFTYGF